MLLRLTDEMKEALPIIEALRQSGHEAVFVGGAVRDAVLGLPIHDVDIATSALPEHTMALFPKCIPTGLQHGTVTVMQKGVPYEVTTYRVESQYEGHRKPKEVVFVQRLDEDLLRRDFTMNAMAIQMSGELYDPYQGERDLREKRLRCVGDAGARFQEDALRMVRAVRFLSAYELAPAMSVWRGLKKHGALLRHVAMERVQAELDKMLGSRSPGRACIWLASSGLLAFWKEPLPEKILNQVNEALRKARAGSESAMPDFSLLANVDERWAALLLAISCGGSEANDILSALRFSNKRSTFILQLIACQEKMESAGHLSDHDSIQLKRSWTEAVLRFGEQTARHWLTVAGSLPETRGSLPKSTAIYLESVLDEMPVKALKKLAAGGSDLQKHLGLPPGPWLSGMLNRLLLAVALGEAANEKDKLLALAKIWSEEDQSHEP
ncbi:CCA tRNA nucleotidyltransferase [Paenibacillus soyae]|uniref:CCA tRNA nucleotidyltransferase n=1 Tax=Paenibacillus soyae TaxID=2969249 RepID=A0A9X2MMB2_9BACL|nr:CCA tRNA nucleotidyltransferase [Paenibacillus soyae]MCR2802980.1 CCA tRNA nucleotidyltransferase [Paenibacillus soyae]